MSEKEKRIKELKEKIFDIDMKDFWSYEDERKWFKLHEELRELEKGK